MVNEFNRLSFLHFLFYSTVTGLYIYTLIYDTKLFREKKYAKVGFPFDDSYGGRAKFLTYIDVVIQTIFFGLSAIIAFGDFFCLSFFSKAVDKEHSGLRIKKLSNFLYTSFAFPIGWLVTITFWSVYFIDRKLVYPKILDTIIPAWENHVLHTLPLVSLAIEALIAKHSYPSFLKGASFTFLFVSSYVVWTLYIAAQTDKWVYQLLKVLSPINRALFIITMALFATFLYKIGEYINSLFWSSNKQNVSTAKKSS